MTEFYDYNQLAEWLLKQSDERLQWIGVDGWPGAGKSTLARRLARQIGSIYVELDNLNADRRHYVETIDYKQIARVSACDSSKVVDGICLREVMKRASIGCTLWLYVKKIDRYGCWVDEKASVDACECREFMNELEIQVADYHLKYQPHSFADAVLAENRSA